MFTYGCMKSQRLAAYEDLITIVVILTVLNIQVNIGKSKKAGIHCDFMKANMNAVKEGCLIDACKHSPASGRNRLDAKQIQNTRPHRH